MPYYHDLVTQHSWEALQTLRRQLEFLLIGGWAVYLYTKALKSKDIDVIVDFPQLATLAKHYTVSKNERLRTYEAIAGEVQIDVYLPHYSRLGLPVELLREHARSVEGFTLLEPTYLLALKLHTLTERARTPKGEKDFLDCLALLQAGVADLAEAAALLKRDDRVEALRLFRILLGEHRQVPELSLNAHHLSRLKKRLVSRP